MKKHTLLTVSAVVLILSMYSALNGQALGPMPLAYHSVGLHADGTVYCWGRNSNGQIGDNTTTTPRKTPVIVLKGAYNGTTYLGDDSGNKMTAVALGQAYSTALAADGTVYTWGSNNMGQLGDNSTTQRETPVLVLMGEYSGSTYLGDDIGNKIIAVALGYFHSAAVAADGMVYTWGNNDNGRLGDNTTNQRSTPVKVLKGEYGGTTYLGDNGSNKIIAIALGGSHAVALADDGTVYAWGNNTNGQVGDNSITQRLTPVKVVKGDYSGTTYLGDNGSNKIIAVAASEYNSIAVAEDGTVYCWGYNVFGQVGDNTTTTPRSSPVKVLKGEYGGTTYLGDSGSNKITDVATGYCFCMALAEDGMVYSWGMNANGRLGDNTTTQRETPVKVLKGSYNGTIYLGDDSGNRITDVASGYSHTIAMAADKTVYSWGDNFSGQLGDDTTTENYTPLKVKGVGGTGDLSLPVGLASFSARCADRSIVLEWATESEVDNLGFILERSAEDPVSWDVIASYEDNDALRGQLNTSSRTEYSYVDHHVEPGHGYYYRLSDMSVQGEGTVYPPLFIKLDAPPEETRLERAYPNPFNPRTHITYHLAEAAKVKITVFDLAGREIKELHTGRQPAGSYLITWNGTKANGQNVSSGVYLIRMQTETVTEIQKVMLLK